MRLTLVQEVATTYIQLRALDRQVEVTRQTLKARQESVDLTRRLESGGSVPLSDLRQAEQLLYTATSEVAAAGAAGAAAGERAHASCSERIRVRLPTRIQTRSRPRRRICQPASLRNCWNAGRISSNRRHSSKRPTRTLALRVRNSFPSYRSVLPPASGEAIAPTSSTATLGPSTESARWRSRSLKAASLRGQLNQAKAADQEMVITYQKTIAGAFRDVSNALIALEQAARLPRAAGEAGRGCRRTPLVWPASAIEGGSTAYLEVLTNDTNLFSAQLNLVTAQQGEALTLVQLYSALGGGWQ